MIGTRFRLVLIAVGIIVIGIAALLIRQGVKSSRLKSQVSSLMGITSRNFDPSLFEKAVQEVANFSEGPHDLPPPYEKITSNGMVYIADDKVHGRLMFFVTWMGKGSNMHAAMRVTDRFDFQKLPEGYQGTKILNTPLKDFPQYQPPQSGIYVGPRPWGTDLKVVKSLGTNWYLVVYDLD